jgi:hypothetical protein
VSVEHYLALREQRGTVQLVYRLHTTEKKLVEINGVHNSHLPGKGGTEC